MKVYFNKRHPLRLYLFIIAVIISSLIESNLCIYVAYFIMLLIECSKLKNGSYEHKVEIIQRFWMRLVLYSVIMPNNYFVIVITVGAFFFNVVFKKVKMFYFSLEISIYFLVRSMLCIFHLQNIFFSLLFWSLFLFGAFWGKYIFKKWNYREVLSIFKELIIIETFSVMTEWIMHIGNRGVDNDWVVGTFGRYNGVQFFVIMIVMGIVLFAEYCRTKSYSAFFYFILAVGQAVMTGSVALTLLFGISLVFFALFISRGIKIKLGIVATIICAILFMFLTNPTWVKKDVMKLLDKEHFLNRAQKIAFLENTFINIPRTDVLFAIIGEGYGRYSSRGALTMTGEYLSFVHNSDMTTYTEKYVLQMLVYCKTNNIGTASLPYSEWASIMGEFGYIGFCLALFVYIRIYRNSKLFQKLLIIIIGIFMIYDNYLEFPRVALWLFLGYYILENIDVGKETRKGSIQSNMVDAV